LKPPIGRAGSNCYRAGNHVGCAFRTAGTGKASAHKILCKFDCLEFDETSHLIRVDFAQNPRFIANDRFNAVW
jgi:hypothetical protein